MVKNEVLIEQRNTSISDKRYWKHSPRKPNQEEDWNGMNLLVNKVISRMATYHSMKVEEEHLCILKF